MMVVWILKILKREVKKWIKAFFLKKLKTIWLIKKIKKKLYNYVFYFFAMRVLLLMVLKMYIYLSFFWKIFFVIASLLNLDYEKKIIN